MTDIDPLWFKDAIIYQLHVKTFCDGNGDGVGDFQGLISKLDYLERLGVTCLWLLPFCDSPLLDDGYDVADYRRVNPAYGTLADVRQFLDAAHQRGLRVITELVINHTSDRHPWFQEARRAPAGSAARDFYVWSDTDRRYAGVRVIFRDTESSNWTWDAVAHAYYWHRFFHHQPDLNFDSPDVRRAVMDVLRFWLDLGVDGLRLDAIAHLYEREGTSCDNLPETHAFLKDVRAEMDGRYPGRILLAEVNQPPLETCEYFGSGDECHMAFHFPLMPRLFQSLATGQAAPIVEAVQATVGIPDGCQWAVFLRNHDELTLSAIPLPEREPLLATYAPAPRMRLNNGIRRRLAPLLGDSRPRIEMATALMLSLPGAPVIYYGDELGMGENIALPDRDGMRTPMQWNGDAHGGFTPAGAKPVLPVLDDAVYGYQRVNVQAQEDDPSSLLARVRTMLRIRRQHPCFGRGSIEFVESGDPRVLAFLRSAGRDGVLVVANLSRSERTATLRLPLSGACCGARDLLSGVTLSERLTLAPASICWWSAPADRTLIQE